MENAIINKIENINSLQDIVEIVGEITTPNDIESNKIIDNIRNIISSYVDSNNRQSLSLGVSGGLDSSVIAAICQQKYTGVPLIGISIPMSSSNAHKEQAQWIGDNYCTAFQEFNEWDTEYFDSGEAEAYDCPTSMLNDVINTVEQTNELAKKAGFNPETFPTTVLEGNIKARLRMVTLYDLARKTNGMVMSTDNLSEFQMGFWTICGDVGDFGPIQNIGKGFELPAIAKALGIREDIISQPPSDGLMVTEENTDEAQLGANYKEVDTIMSVYLNTLPIDTKYKKKINKAMFTILNRYNGNGAEKIDKVISRYEALAFKRNGTINLTRNQIGI